MPLAAYIEERVAELRAFLADPNAVALQVCVRPEIELTAARLLAAACNDDADPALLIGFTAEFRGAESFCAELQRAVAAEVEVALEELDGEQLAFRLPTGMSEERSIPIEVRLVEYLEGIARAMHGHVRRVVVALDVHTENAPAWAETLARLLANTGSDLLAWVVFDREADLGAVAYHRHRTAIRRPDEELEHLLTMPGARMLTFIHAPNTPSPTTIVRRLHERTRGSSFVWVTLEVPPLPFVAPLQYWTNAARALAQQLRGSVHAAPLIAEIEELAAYPEAEMAFAEFCNRLAVAALRPDVGLVIVLRPSDADPTEYTASLDRLARACVSTRVKLVTFDPRTQPATPERRPVRRFELDLGPERMEAGIEAKLAKPDLPLRERMQLTMALANLRLGQDRHEEAFALDLHALELAHASPEPTDMAIAWYQLGNAHYRLNFLEDAEQAYAESAHRALEADQPGLAGMALVGAGHALFCRSETAPALQAYEAATTLFTRLGLLQHEVFARTWTGQTLVLARRFGEARDAFEAALRRCDTIDPAHAQTIAGSRADILHRMAYLYSLAGRADLERKYRHEAEALGAAQPPCMHP